MQSAMEKNKAAHKDEESLGKNWDGSYLKTG